MPTNLHLEDELINKAVTLGKHKTKKAAVTRALVEYVERLEQEKIISLFNTVDYYPEYDYKKQRTLGR
jgi:ribosomal protein S12 methylthiotransferase accessory factor YcaO